MTSASKPAPRLLLTVVLTAMLGALFGTAMGLAGCARAAWPSAGQDDAATDPDPDPDPNPNPQPQPQPQPEPEPEPECEELSFVETETQEVFLVPDNARYMHVKAWGAGGNGECSADSGGVGGFSSAVFEVTPGTPLIVIVGKRGRSGMTGEERIKFGFGDWGGGGLSGVFLGPDPIDQNAWDRALVIAGGGGSAGVCDQGHPGNHPNFSGGMSSMQGGVGFEEVNGGAGGYRGGIGGGQRAPSNGGSGFVSDDAIDSVIEWAEIGEIVPARVDDPDYDGMAGQTETSGLVVIHFVCTPPPVL